MLEHRSLFCRTGERPCPVKLKPNHINILRPRQNGHHFMGDTFKCVFLNDNAFWLKFHWNLFFRVKLTIFHYFRKWLGADQVTSHYLNQCWLEYRCIYVSFGLQEISSSEPWNITVKIAKNKKKYKGSGYQLPWHCESLPRVIKAPQNIGKYVPLFGTSVNMYYFVNTLRPRQHGHHFPDGIFKCIFFNENACIAIEISLILFLRVQLTIVQHRFGQWLGANQAPSHSLNQWWLVYWCIYASPSLNELRCMIYIIVT